MSCHFPRPIEATTGVDKISPTPLELIEKGIGSQLAAAVFPSTALDKLDHQKGALKLHELRDECFTSLLHQHQRPHKPKGQSNFTEAAEASPETHLTPLSFHERTTGMLRRFPLSCDTHGTWSMRARTTAA